MWRADSTRVAALIVGALFASAAYAAVDADRAQMAWAAPNATRAEASAKAAGAPARALAAELRGTLMNAPKDLPDRLEALTHRDDIAWPVREAALMQLLDDLGALHRDQVPAAAMETLTQWQARTLVPHEEDPRIGTALFPIAARAQGLENRWRRDEAMQAGAALLDRDDTTAFLERWLDENDAAARAGLIDALSAARADTVRDVLRRAEAGLAATPALATPARDAAIALHDLDAMTRLIGNGSGAELRPLLQALADVLDADALTSVLARLDQRGAASATALAIGVWSPKLAGQPAAERLLLGKLDDADLGSSAALALSIAPTPDTVAKLQQRAALPDMTAGAQRARLALQLEQQAEMPR